MNSVFIIGNLTRDPELRTVDSGAEVATFTVAVNRRVRNDAPQQTDYFRCSAWGNLAGICSQYLHKGNKVYIAGPVRARAYTGSDGNAHASLEVTVREMEFLTPKGAAKAGSDGDFEDYDGELPFDEQ